MSSFILIGTQQVVDVDGQWQMRVTSVLLEHGVLLRYFSKVYPFRPFQKSRSDTHTSTLFAGDSTKVPSDLQPLRS